MRLNLLLLLICSLTKSEANCVQSITRVKNAPSHLREKILEFPIDQIHYIHEVPNPLRTDHSANFLDELSEKIQREGFQEIHAVPLMRMPDGLIYCMGHHRTEAMKRLGQTTVPAYIYDWDSIGIEAQKKAIQEYPELTKHLSQYTY